MTPTAESHRRRSQAERSAATREALMDATIRCLIEEGYATTTTARVAERAGVSRGAHLHHFQTRSALLAAAIQHLARRRGEELRAAADALQAGPGRTAAGLDLLWSGYASPMSQAALDLWAAGRTDAELREHLVPFEKAMDRHTMELARRLFPDAAARPDFDELVEFVLATIRGLSLLDTLHPGGGRNAKQWRSVRPRLVALLDGR
jgi:AcrR family transcriptional regulator